MLSDTHAHIQFPDYLERLDEVLHNAEVADVGLIFAVGVDIASSIAAVELAKQYDHIHAIVGLHPNDAIGETSELVELASLARSPEVIGIGECGLDYSRENHDKLGQEQVFRAQIELALELELPLAFHVRDAFPDFFRIIDDYPQARGLVHCFTATTLEMQSALERGFYIALNGIMTFSKNPKQLEAARQIPLNRLLLETDSPFLAPVPRRGQMNEPAFVRLTAEYLADLRGESFSEFETTTTANAKRLFGLN